MTGVIEISLQIHEEKVIFSVKDCGIGIPPEMHKKVFEPYYQIANQKRNIQGMGLGLPIVKKVIQDLNEIQIDSNPKVAPGTKITVILPKYTVVENEVVSAITINKKVVNDIDSLNIKESLHNPNKSTILIVEDNVSMVNYLFKKLQADYNVYAALNGSDALKKMKSLSMPPDLIISDIYYDGQSGWLCIR